MAWMMEGNTGRTRQSDGPSSPKHCAPTQSRWAAMVLNERLNVTAFGNAYRRFAGEIDARFTEWLRAEVAELNSNFQALEYRFYQSQRDLKEANNVDSAPSGHHQQVGPREHHPPTSNRSSFRRRRAGGESNLIVAEFMVEQNEETTRTGLSRSASTNCKTGVFDGCGLNHNH